MIYLMIVDFLQTFDLVFGNCFSHRHCIAVTTKRIIYGLYCWILKRKRKRRTENCGATNCHSRLPRAFARCTYRAISKAINKRVCTVDEGSNCAHNCALVGLQRCILRLNPSILTASHAIWRVNQRNECNSRMFNKSWI